MTTAERPAPTTDQIDDSLKAKAFKLACDFDQLQQRTPISDGPHIAQRHILDVDPGTVIEIDGHLVPLPGVEHKATETA